MDFGLTAATVDIWNSIPSQLAKENKKFIYGLAKEGARAREYEDALLWLKDSGMIRRGGRVSGGRMPLKAYDLINTMEMMLQTLDRRRKKRKKELKNRNPEQQALIKQAKELLMARNNMSEEEAHRYLQKSSMDSGTNMVETAEMVLSVMS